MTIMAHKTTKEDFDLFVSVSKKEIKRLGLTDWKIWHQHDIDTKFKEACALCVTSYEDKQAAIQLNTVWEEKPTKDAIRYYAIHETLELLLADFSYHAENRQTSPDELNAARHALIQRLINASY